MIKMTVKAGKCYAMNAISGKKLCGQEVNEKIGDK